jgi:hypothetical protein
MKIQVDRTNTSEGNLVFTITVSNPHHSCFGEIEKNIMNLLDFCKEGVQNLSPEDNKVRNDVIGLIHNAKEKAFMRVLDNLKFAIENEFRPKFKPICQEIYNWIYDNQTDLLKKWMSEFDPQRTKYYFDNDIKAFTIQLLQESEHDEDDEDEEDDD